MSFVEGDAELMLLAGQCIGLFMAGVILGAFVQRFSTFKLGKYRAREAVMILVATLFSISALLLAVGLEWACLLLLSLGIGAMNSVFERDGEVSVAVTYVTGTLVKADAPLPGCTHCSWRCVCRPAPWWVPWRT